MVIWSYGAEIPSTKVSTPEEFVDSSRKSCSTERVQLKQRNSPKQRRGLQRTLKHIFKHIFKKNIKTMDKYIKY